jgi:hypothetical protein
MDDENKKDRCTKADLSEYLIVPFPDRHNSAHEFVEERDGKRGIAMIRTPNHSLSD